LQRKKAEYEQKNNSKGEDPNKKNKENKEKQKKEKQAKQKQTNKRKKLDDEGNVLNETPEKKAKTDEGEEKKEGEQKEEPFFFKKDLLIKITELKEDSTREHLRDFFQALGGHVGYVDFSKGQTTGTLQLNEDDTTGAKGLVAKAKESSLELGGKPAKDITFEALADADEEAYWKKVGEKKKQFRQEKANNKKRKGGKRGGRGGKRGGGGGKRQKKGRK